jgi:polysaccharide biosynthesis acetyltransferase WcbI-like protein
MGARAPLRIAIVGWRQVASLAVAIEHFLPEAEVKAWHVGVHPPESEEQIAAQLPDYDLVISQIDDDEGAGVLALSHLRETIPKLVFLPLLVFRGFQPDCIYLHSPRRGMVKGYLGDMHSAIIAGSYVLGLPEHRVPALFNSLTFATLGHFQAFAAAREHLLERFHNHGFDLSSRIEAWQSQYGAFMYLPLHPKLGVMRELARIILRDWGLDGPNFDVPIAREDPLAYSAQWPTYPDLARRLKVPGSMTFVRPIYGLEAGAAREIALHQLVEHSYRIYREIPIDELRETVPADSIAQLDRLLGSGARS